MERYKYRVEIQQMMFVSGATADPPLETTKLVEDIVRGQVVELLSQSSSIARKRGARAVSVEDVLYTIRHDLGKVSRLRNYMSWKEVRKNARDQEGAPAEGENMIDDPDEPVTEPSRKPKRQYSALSWKINSIFSLGQQDDDALLVEDALGEDLKENACMMERLRNADIRTRNMTREEYVHWSECRQASFTFRKAKRFKDWAGISQVADGRLQDDIIDILGFLTFEIVVNLTELALKVQEHELRPSDGQMVAETSTKERHLFDRPNKLVAPLLPRHIREAYRRFQQPLPKNTAMQAFWGGFTPQNAKLI